MAKMSKMRNSEFEKQLQLQLMRSSSNQKHVRGFVAAIAKMAYGKRKDQVLDRVRRIISTSKQPTFQTVTYYFWIDNYDAYQFCHEVVQMFKRQYRRENERNDFTMHSNLIALFASFGANVLQTLATKPAAIMDQSNDSDTAILMSEMEPNQMALNDSNDVSTEPDQNMGSDEEKINQIKPNAVALSDSDGDATIDVSTEPDQNIGSDEEKITQMKPNAVALSDSDDDDDDDVVFYLAEEGQQPVALNEYDEDQLQMSQNNEPIPNSATFACSKCFKIGALMSVVLLHDCLHSFCRECIRESIFQNDGSKPIACLCNQCDGIVQEQNIKSVLTSAEFTDYESKLASSLDFEYIKQIEDKMAIPTDRFVCSFCMESCVAIDCLKFGNCMHDICQICIKELVRRTNNACNIKCPVCNLVTEKQEVLSPPKQFEIKTQHKLQSSAVHQPIPNSFNRQTTDDIAEITPPIMNEYEALLKMYQNNELVLNPDSFACGKCFKICAPMSGVLLQDCLHSFCRDCIRDRILSNDGSELVACYYNQCDGFVQEQEIKSLLSFVELKDYEYKRICSRNGTTEYNKLINLDDVQMVASTDRFECPICIESCAAKDGIKLRNCLHDLCQICCKELIRHIDNEYEVKCPVCNSLIEEREIRALLPPAEFTKYLQRVLRSSVQQIRNAFNCRTIDCTGFTIFDDEDVDFVCPFCDRRNCIACKAIHENLTCGQYDEICTGKEQMSKEYIKMIIDNGTAMMCPLSSCGAVISKIAGCDGMTCSRCKTDICWATKGPRWGPRGKNDTSGGCRCNINGKRCHPQCQNCH